MKKLLLSAFLANSIFANDNYVEFVAGYIEGKNNFSINSDEKYFPKVSLFSQLGYDDNNKSNINDDY